jgi:hypothetical protein
MKWTAFTCSVTKSAKKSGKNFGPRMRSGVTTNSPKRDINHFQRPCGASAPLFLLLHPGFEKCGLHTPHFPSQHPATISRVRSGFFIAVSGYAHVF